MHFAIRYLTEYRYEEPVTDNLNALRVTPATTPHQRVDDFGVRVDPETRLHQHLDYFGTTVIEFGISKPHEQLSIDVRARVRTTTAAGAAGDGLGAGGGARLPRRAAASSGCRSATEPDCVLLDELVGLSRAADAGRHARARSAELIPDRFEYRPGVTYVGSTSTTCSRPAPACARTSPTSRWCCCAATGSRRATSPATCSRRRRTTRPPTSAEVDTHAWIEALLPAADGGEPVWVAADPTNRGLVGERHVKIGHGRHYSDVPPIRGVYRGGASAELDASVRMTRTDTRRARTGAGLRPSLVTAMELRPPVPEDAPAVLELIVARDVADLGRPDYTLEDVRADWSAPGIDARARRVARRGGRRRARLRAARRPRRGADHRPARDRGPRRRQRAARGGGGARARARRGDRAPVRPDRRTRRPAPGCSPPATGRHTATSACGWTSTDAPGRPPAWSCAASAAASTTRPVHALVEEAMAGVAGNEARSLESWQAAKIDKEGWDPALWLLHEDADGLAGVVLCERWEDGVGYVDYLAVAPRVQRPRASAARCCCTASPRCAPQGSAVVELSVQGENAGATRLYESVGMAAGVDDRALGEDAPASRVEHDGDGGREVQARDPGPHRDPDARVGARPQRGAQPVALGAEGEHGVVGERAAERVPVRIDGDERAVGRRRRRRGRPAARSAGPPSRAAPPGPTGRASPVVEHAGGARGGGDPHGGADVAGVARGLEQHDAGPARARPRRTAGGARRRGRRCGARRGRASRRHRRHARRASSSGASSAASAASPSGSVVDRGEQVGAEAQRVLERVEALEQHEPGVAPRAAASSAATSSTGEA